MRALHLYFQLHQPYVLSRRELNQGSYFGGEAEFREANRTEYQPLFALLERNSQKYEHFKVTLGVSGVWLEQAERWDAELIRRLQKLVNRGKVELTLMPYFGSVANFYNAEEFEAQIELMRQKLYRTFTVEPQVLAMPELIYHDKLATWAEKSGLKAALAGGMNIVLDYRMSNQVFEAEGCKDFRIIAENERFSRALMRAEDLVVVETERPVEDFSALGSRASKEVAQKTVAPAGVTAGALHRNSKQAKRASATEFVRGMAGVRRAEKIEKHVHRAAERTGVMMFSSRKICKELELEALRGNVITLVLEPRIFREQAALGVVRCFDEVIAAWLKQGQNRFLAASEVLDAASPKEMISVVNTVSARNVIYGQNPEKITVGLAKLDDVRFAPPAWLRQQGQVETARKLYGYRADVLKLKDKDFYREWQGLTDYRYLLPDYGNKNSDSEEQRELRPVGALEFAKVIEDFAARLLDKMPKYVKLPAKAGADTKKTKAEAELTENPFAVKVHRVHREKRPEEAEPTMNADGELMGVVIGEMKYSDWDELLWQSEHPEEAGDETLDNEMSYELNLAEVESASEAELVREKRGRKRRK